MILLIIVFPGVAFADVGLPMLAIVWPLSVPTIIPVIAIESWLVRRELNVEWHTAIIQMTKANIFSTAVGIPIAWIASVALELILAYLVMNLADSKSYPPYIVGEVGAVILSAPWLGPFHSGRHWIIPVATTVLLVPFFFASFWVEAWYVARSLRSEAPEKVRKAVWNANFLSYSAILAACVIWLAVGVAAHV
jgi:hypothetical protein